MDLEYLEIKPKGVLSMFIDCIWWENFHEGNENQRAHYLVPDKSIELIFTSSIIQRTKNENKQATQNKSQICGIRTKPQVCVLDKSPAISVRFYPRSFYRLCQLDIKDTIDQSLTPEDVFGNSILQLDQLVLNAKSQSNRIELIEDYFKGYIEYSLKESDLLFELMISKIEQSNGTIPIRELSEEFSLSLKTIERKFNRHLGMPPKKYSRIVRFTNHYMKDRDPESIDGKLDFYDQAHFIREVKKFTGLSPESFNAKKIGIQRVVFRKTSY